MRTCESGGRIWGEEKKGKASAFAATRDICVGIAPTVADVAANVPTRPAIDRRGRWWRRCLDGHISCKRQTAAGKAESRPGKTGYELVAHWPDPPILSLIFRISG